MTYLSYRGRILIMKTLVFVFISLFLAGCGSNTPMNAPEETVPFIQEHLDLDNLPISVTVNLTVEIVDNVDDNPNVQGRCERWSDGRKHISLRRSYWNAVNDDARRVLMHHELGHCLRAYEHRGEAQGGVITSIMWPHLLDTEEYKKRKGPYHKELVTKKWEP